MILRIVLIAAVLAAATSLRAETYLVEDGKPRAAIVIAENAARSTLLAADELRATIETISGATLPIETTPRAEMRVFVGESEHTRSLGIDCEGLEHGGYRIVSGSDWLALVGKDRDFQPLEPWARNNSERQQLQARWEAASGLPYGVPNGGMYKNRQRMPAELATEPGEYFWGFDERGSYNAVCGFLRRLGVRWYLPGELGAVIPQRDSIPLPQVDQTVRPDFELRQFNVRFGTADEEITRWAMRLGIRQLDGLKIAHGMHTMTHPDELKAEKPDWFALYGGHRDTQTGKRLNHLCYSNEGLFRETVKWARAQFDVYDYEAVSIMPPDAYISICQCPLCAGKQLDEMGPRGKLSDHVWDFVNRVAKEVGKTHPDKRVLCLAYGTYTLPPTNIEKLEPNVQVMIVGGRRPRNTRPEQRAYVRDLRDGWLQKTDRPIMIFENYPFTARGTYLPAFVANTIGESINATKGVSAGEDIWLSFPRYHDDPHLGFDHFQVYFTARMWWGGKDADVDGMLEEYCGLFYGPAGSQMKAFFDYCEANYQAMEDELEPVHTALEMFAAAKSTVDAESTYGQRLGLIDSFLERLRTKAELLAQGRGPLAKLRTVWEPKEPIVIDGRLDDQYWVDCPVASVGQLRELQTGRQPVFGTEIMAGWDRSGQNLYFAIRCDERSGAELNVSTTDREDPAIWYGDAVEIELATDSHSYYQIAVNPAGAVIDLDRGADKSAWLRWDSRAEVATHIEDDQWTVEIRIPVTEDDNDPLHQVVGHQPSQSLPWHFNICRQRIRDNGSEYSAFSPTGAATFHLPLKFAYFYDGRSHTFPVDESVTDFLIAFDKAGQLKRARRVAEARDAFTRLANRDTATDLQRSRSFAAAAECARLMDDDVGAAELGGRIPLDAIAKTAEMELLADQREWNKILERFGEEELRRWQFTEISAAARVRGRAFFAAGNGERAEADFQLALEYTSDSRTRMRLFHQIAQNRETVISDQDLALEAYQEICRSTQHTGSADYFRGIQGAARIFVAQRKFDEAIEVLELVDAPKLGGTWGGSMLLLRGQTLQSAGRVREAAEAFQAVADSNSATERQVQAAAEALESIGVPGK